MEVKGRMKQLITFAILVLTCVHHFHRGGMGQAHLYVQDYVLPNPNQDTGSSERSPPEECTNQNPNCGDGKSCVLDSRAKRSKFMDKGSMIKGKCLLTPEGMDPTANVNSAGHCTQFIHDCAEDYSCYLVHTEIIMKVFVIRAKRVVVTAVRAVLDMDALFFGVLSGPMILHETVRYSSPH